MGALQQRITVMQEEMATLSDLDSLRDQAQEKRTLLDEESKVLTQLKGPANLALMEAQMKHDQLQVHFIFILGNHCQTRLNKNFSIESVIPSPDINIDTNVNAAFTVDELNAVKSYVDITDC